MNTPQGGVALAALRLDDAELIESGDPGGMLRQVASSAAQVRTALRACAEADLSELSPEVRPRAIVVAGSGGAGGAVFACDALAAISRNRVAGPGDRRVRIPAARLDRRRPTW